MSDITMYGAEWCADCRRSKALLDGRGVEYTYVDLEAQPEAVEIVLEQKRGASGHPHDRVCRRDAPHRAVRSRAVRQAGALNPISETVDPVENGRLASLEP